VGFSFRQSFSGTIALLVGRCIIDKQGVHMDELSKIKHSKRLQKDENTVKKQTKIAKQHGTNVEKPHKFAKTHAMNCGNPKCVMCMNPRKSFGEKTMQEKKFEQRKLHDE
jgi:hypothetical protein